ncbi:hypothetical protein [Paenibacillus pinihumi]|uniref:hypothetical protein n=1 Tax=Paenibacillus pinihumi TaxID=669462 RepID=UPI00041FBB63|nr:hypothetical protein [Paenibacillus pinihumi]
MKKLYTLLLLALMLNGCGIESQMNNPAPENQPLTSNQKQVDDKFTVYDEWTENGLQLEMHYLDLKAGYKLYENCFLETASAIKLDQQTEGLLLKINGNDPNMIINHDSDNRFAYLIWANIDGHLELIFNSLELEINKDDNYITSITDDKQISITDTANDFKADFTPYISEGEEKFYQDIINDPDQVKGLFTASKWFMAVEFLEDETTFRIKLTKLFGGYRSANPSGYFEYQYTYENGKFYLNKEAFYTVKGLNLIDPVLIKNVDYN